MDRDAYLDVHPSLRLSVAELQYRASRAGGPGGQHVNTSSTRIEVVWNVAASPSLTEEQRTRLLAKLASRLDSEGQLRVVSSSSRSQWRNREEATERLCAIIGAALVVPKPRKRTKPSRTARAARLDAKRRRSAIKRGRGRGVREGDRE